MEATFGHQNQAGVHLGDVVAAGPVRQVQDRFGELDAIETSRVSGAPGAAISTCKTTRAEPAKESGNSQALDRSMHSLTIEVFQAFLAFLWAARRSWVNRTNHNTLPPVNARCVPRVTA